MPLSTCPGSQHFILLKRTPLPFKSIYFSLYLSQSSCSVHSRLSQHEISWRHVSQNFSQAICIISLCLNLQGQFDANFILYQAMCCQMHPVVKTGSDVDVKNFPKPEINPQSDLISIHHSGCLANSDLNIVIQMLTW